MIARLQKGTTMWMFETTSEARVVVAEFEKSPTHWVKTFETVDRAPWARRAYRRLLDQGFKPIGGV